jgi:hypothetical protein
MAKQTIFIGQTANDRTGDPLRTAFVKVNSNFDELYARTGDDLQIPVLAGNTGKVLTTNGTTLIWTTDSTTTSQLVNGSKTVSLGTDGNLTLPLQGKIMPVGDVNSFLTFNWGDDVELKAGDNLYLSGSVATIRTNSNSNLWTFGTDGKLTLPNSGTIDNSIDTNSNQSIELTPNNLSQTTATIIVDKNGPPNAQWATVQVGWTITVGLVTRTINSITGDLTTVSFVLNGTVALPMTGSVIFQSPGMPSLAITPNGTTTWTFNSNGTLDLPNTGSIQQKFVETKVTQSNIILNASSGVIWTANNPYASGVKLIIQAEIDETGDATGWHSQVCEAIVASRGYASSASGPLGDPQMTVYGVTYTSTEPLITFTVQRDPITNLIEVTGNRTATALSSARVDFRIHSVEMSTSD